MNVHLWVILLIVQECHIPYDYYEVVLGCITWGLSLGYALIIFNYVWQVHGFGRKDGPSVFQTYDSKPPTTHLNSTEVSQPNQANQLQLYLDSWWCLRTCTSKISYLSSRNARTSCRRAVRLTVQVRFLYFAKVYRLVIYVVLGAAQLLSSCWILSQMFRQDQPKRQQSVPSGPDCSQPKQQQTLNKIGMRPFMNQWNLSPSLWYIFHSFEFLFLPFKYDSNSNLQSSIFYFPQLPKTMQFDILNELITSTVGDLFTNSQKIVIQCKPKVKELEGLIKLENNSSRRGSMQSNDSFSVISDNSKDGSVRAEVPKYQSVAEWMQKEADKRRKQAFKKLGLDQTLMRPTRKIELEQYIEVLSIQGLGNEKKKVKNELKSYDNDFTSNFNRQPNHDEKEPLRPLYVYYKKLKESLTRRGGEQMSQQKIQAMISNIKKERRELREQIETYQKQFEQNNNRRIRYVRDISPIDTQYRKYKELKAELQKYEEMLKG